MPVSGEVFTELEALDILCNVKTDLIAGGGVSGAEGSVWLGITGDDNSLEIAEKVMKSVSFEEPFNI